MAAKYLIRFDDICSTMNWDIWSQVEALLLQYKVNPILAVVPDNRDANLEVAAPRADFWDQVREWQRRGWTIGWHGYQHVYTSASGGIVDIHFGSEFAGFSADVQRESLAAAAHIFKAQAVAPRVWVAPGHAFDEITVSVLREFGIDVISDGFYFRVVRRAGSIWLPQQLWRFRPMSFGLWTVCMHINSWGEAELLRFEGGLRRFVDSIVSFEAAISGAVSPVGLVDRIFEISYGAAVRARLRRACGNTG